MDYKEKKPNKYYTPKLRLRVSDENKQKILTFFETHKELKKSAVCKKLCIPLGAINTLKGKRPFVKYEYLQKLLIFITQWETS
jgi:hypothetical protein